VRLPLCTPWRHMGVVNAQLYSFLTSARDGRVANLPLRLLYSRGKSPRHPLKRRLGGTQSRSGRSGEKKSLPVLEVEIRIVLSVTCHFNDHDIRKQQQQQQQQQQPSWSYRLRYDKCQQVKKNYDHAYRSGLLQSYETGKDTLWLLLIKDFSFTSRDASVSKVCGHRQYQRDLTSFL